MDAIERVEHMIGVLENHGMDGPNAALRIETWLRFYNSFPGDVAMALMRRCVNPVGKMVGIEVWRQAEWARRN